MLNSSDGDKVSSKLNSLLVFELTLSPSLEMLSKSSLNLFLSIIHLAGELSSGFFKFIVDPFFERFEVLLWRLFFGEVLFLILYSLSDGSLDSFFSVAAENFTSFIISLLCVQVVVFRR